MDSVKSDLAVKIDDQLQKVGVEMERPDGSTYLLISRDFRPASVPNPKNHQNVLVQVLSPGKFSSRKKPWRPKIKGNDGGIFCGSIVNPIKRERET